MFDLFFHALTSLTSFVFPIIASYKALEHNDITLIRPWLIYWVIVAIQVTIESYFSVFLRILPFYQFSKFLLTLWLVLPQFQGATNLYLNYVAPFLRHHEQEIDHLLATGCDTCKSMGLKYSTQFIAFVKEAVYSLMFGPRPADSKAAGESTPGATTSARLTPDSTHPSGATSSASYVDMLMSKFRIPESAYNFRSSQTYAYSVGSLFSTFNVQSGADLLSNIFTLPSGLSKSGRLSYIDQQRAKLVSALTQLDEKRAMVEEEEDKEKEKEQGIRNNEKEYVKDNEKSLPAESVLPGLLPSVPSTTKPFVRSEKSSSSLLSNTTDVAPPSVNGESESEFDVVLEDEAPGQHLGTAKDADAQESIQEGKKEQPSGWFSGWRS